MATTTNYGWTKPVVGGDNGSWGTELNSTLDGIDSQMKTTDNGQVAANAAAAAAQTTANAALPKAGGVMTGRLDAKNATGTVTTPAGSSGTITLDLSTGNYFLLNSLTGNATIALSNVPAGGVSLAVEIPNGGSWTVTWPAAFKWTGGSAPAQTASGTDVYSAVTFNGGTSWWAARTVRAGA